MSSPTPDEKPEEASAPATQDHTTSSPAAGQDRTVSSPGADLTDSEVEITLKMYCICAFAAFGGILFGYDSGYISGVLAMNQFKLHFGSPGSNDPNAYEGHMYETWQKSLITSILSAGTFFGALSSGYFADKCGRRSTIIAGCIIYMAGVVLQVAADSVGLLTGGRALAGVGVGFVSCVVLLYASEMSPKKIRGAVISAYQFAITLGLLLAAGVNKGTENYTDTGAYRIPIALQFAWAIILGGGLFFLPESPRWFIMKKDPERAAEALAKVRSVSPNSHHVQQELSDLTRSYTREMVACSGATGWLDCFRGGFAAGSNLRRTLIGMSVQMMQQLTGVNFIFYYGTTFFKQAGINMPFLVTLITTVVNVVSTPISFYTIEKFGRRPLLIWGAIGMCISEFIIAIVGSTTHSDVSHIILIVFVCVYIFFFASTWGPTGWCVSAEIFPLTIRAKGMSLSTASNWLWNFIIGFSTPYLVDVEKANLGSKVFFIWGATCAACVFFALFCVYETKGLSLEEVDVMVKECSPITSASWKPERSENTETEEPGLFRRLTRKRQSSVGDAELGTAQSTCS